MNLCRAVTARIKGGGGTAECYSISESSATIDGAATQRRALAALILAGTECQCVGHGTRLPTERNVCGPVGAPLGYPAGDCASCRPRDAHPGKVGRETFLRLRAACRPHVWPPGSGRWS